MLNRYYEAEQCKKDITMFCDMVCQDKRISINKMKNVAKNILFLKKFFNYYVDDQQHYYSCLISDMFLLVQALSQNSIRNYFVTYRSLIENLIRVLLKYDDKNATGVRNMFSEFRDCSTKIYVDYLEGEYGKCCEVVHSNCNFSVPMYNFYEELLVADEVDAKKIDEYCTKMISFYGTLRRYLIDNKPNDIWEAFQNSNEVLYVLIGKKDYQDLERKSTMPLGSSTSQTDEKSECLVLKSYELKQEVVEQFADACEVAGVSQAAQLTKIMKKFIEETNQREG